jgi:hypothetical protein
MSSSGEIVTAGSPRSKLDRIFLLRMRRLLHLIRAPVDLQRLAGTRADDLDDVR